MKNIKSTQPSLKKRYIGISGGKITYRVFYGNPFSLHYTMKNVSVLWIHFFLISLAMTSNGVFSKQGKTVHKLSINHKIALDIKRARTRSQRSRKEKKYKERKRLKKYKKKDYQSE